MAAAVDHTARYDLDFRAQVWEWRGPAPFYFATVPEEESEAIHDIATEVTYGWGMIPVQVRVGQTEWCTSLWPKDGSYVVPLKAWVRRAEAMELGDDIRVELAIQG